MPSNTKDGTGMGQPERRRQVDGTPATNMGVSREKRIKIARIDGSVHPLKITRNDYISGWWLTYPYEKKI